MMRAVWLVLVAGFRRQWRSWVLLGLLIAVASGFVLAFSVREVPPASLGRVAKLVAGRMPDPSSPVKALASFTLQRDHGVGLGTVGVAPVPVVQAWLIVALAAGALLAANALAAVPAISAARSRPGPLLRTE